MKLNLGCGKDYRDDWVNVDISQEVKTDVRHDLASFPYPWKGGKVDVIEASHVVEHFDAETTLKFFEEAERVLKPGGELRITVPLGTDARTDPTHQSFWTWETFEYFSVDSPQFGWEVETDLELVDRDIKLWTDFQIPVLSQLGKTAAYLIGLYLGWKGVQTLPYISGEATGKYIYRGEEF